MASPTNRKLSFSGMIETAAKLFVFTVAGLVALILVICFFYTQILVSPPFILLAVMLIWGAIFLYKKIGMNGTISDFWLDPVQKQAFKEAHSKWLVNTRELSFAIDEAEEKNVKINVDGSYFRGSMVGQRANKAIEQCTPIITTNAAIINHYEWKPRQEWMKFHRRRDISFAAACAITAWLLVYVFCFWILGVHDHLEPIEYLSLQVSKNNYLSFIFAGLSAAASFVLVKIFLNKRGNKYTPEPPMVSIENIDVF